MTQEPDRVIEESQLREILLRAYQLKCAEVESLTARLAALTHNDPRKGAE